MRVLIDMDEVLVSFVPKAVYYFNKLTGESLRPDDITTWDLPGERRVWDEIFRIPSFFRDLPWEHHCTEDTLRKWAREGHDLRIVTSPASWEACADKYGWVHTHLKIPGIIPSMDKLVITRDKSIVTGDVLIDDSPKNLEAHEAVRIAYDKPWNRGFDADFRARDWNQLWGLDLESLADRVLRSRRIREEYRGPTPCVSAWGPGHQLRQESETTCP